MKKITLLLAGVLLLASCGSRENAATDTTKTETAEAPVKFPAATRPVYNPDGSVHELENAHIYPYGCTVPNLTVLDFNAVWCGPCRQLAPVLGDLAAEYTGKVTFVSIDVDTYGELFQAYNVGDAIPAVVILRPDGTRQSYIGTGDLLPAAKFRAIIDANL